MPDGEWTVTAGADAVTFGKVGASAYFREAPDLGDYEITTEDASVPDGDGVFVGADYFGSRTVTFNLGISRATEAAALTALADVRRVWRADGLRRTPGATATLTARQGGRERITYGRPRKITESLADLPQGLVTVSATFLAVTELWFGATEESAAVTLVPAPTGGFVAPFVFPLTSSASSDRSTDFTVGGELPAWPVIEVTGPLTSPSVEVVGLWRLDFPGLSLAADQTLRIDTRPWARSITRNGVSVAGSVSRRSVRLADATIPPGTHELVIRGASESGTAAARLAWRETFTSI